MLYPSKEHFINSLNPKQAKSIHKSPPRVKEELEEKGKAKNMGFKSMNYDKKFQRINH